ncbi:hypothetical protein [Bordetella bronchiseptica]|uniref:Phage protein n=1 Tax=Bordetella bronchiseptica 00-P-2796 TaxID=1331199 RepID=A0ABR4RDT7_BORBO|nr:hypothetical protein [Bordetella bronchiseptica]KCV34148.1 hypothetical protein L490_5253 [Bordetella bronchiseptica 00-P-2796]KDC15262.1 hypothetical protein L542_2146 [Bordetella bronchiseptica F-1]KDC29239.1 hypothetical protein L504_2175 [Bordetella bronchiseptica F2]
MAGIGSFAGGLADGMRNGMVIANAVEAGDERRRKRELNRELAAAMLQDAQEPGASPGLVPVAVDQPELASPGVVQGLQPTARPADMPAAQAAGPGTDYSAAAGLSDVAAPQLPAAQRASATGPAAMGLERAAQSPMDLLGGGEFGQVADGLTRAYRKALEMGEPGRAMELLVDRERFAGQHRQAAYDTAMGRYQLTGDPNAFVPFVNRFMPGGIEVEGIERRAETAGGAPVYVFKGVDSTTGKKVEQPFSEEMLRNFLGGISNPEAQKAMVAHQAKALFDAEVQRRNKAFESELRTREDGSREALSHRNRMTQIAARGEEDRKSDAARAGSERGSAAPSEVRTAQWLIENGVAKDANDAWGLVRGTRSKSREEYVMDTSHMLLKNQDPAAFGPARLTPQQAVQQAEQLWDSLRRPRNEEGASDASGDLAVGAVEGGYRYKGGDPADSKNWEKV